MSSAKSVFIPIGVIVIGVIFVWKALFGTSQRLEIAAASSNWPAIEGTIVTSETHKKSDSQGPYETWELSYRYMVHGEIYLGDKFDFGEQGYATGTPDQYPVGRHVQVYYDPDNPELAVLVPGLPNERNPVLIMGVLILGFGLYLLIQFIRTGPFHIL